MNLPNYEEYQRMGEPDKAERARNWATAIGLQAVDGLQTSAFLRDTANRNIEGEISIEEAQRLVHSYYETRQLRHGDERQVEEADRASSHITRLLSEPSFSFSVTGLAGIHRRIFEGVFKHAGKFRDYDITKKEWVLAGDTVIYGVATELRRTVEYDLDREKQFSYLGLSIDKVIEHIARFTADLWQIHPFGEGNTRTTAVFLIKYLRSIGFNVNNDPFMEHSWYFRNALVRANYRNATKGIEPTSDFLVRFFSNLLLGTTYELKNRYMLVGTAPQVADTHPTSTRQVPDKCGAYLENLISLMGERRWSMRELLSAMGLKDRENFHNVYLTPALKQGYVTMLYPDSPRHPRQKYYLTVKGQALYNSLKAS